MKRISLLFALCWFATSAPAQHRERVKTRTIIDFDEVEIEGAPDLPHHAYVSVPPRPRFKTLVTVRGTFVPELQKSTDNL